MAIVTAFFGGVGLVATARRVPAHLATLEWCGGLLLVTSLVALGFDLGPWVG